jgi:hypothetical protein
LQQCVLAAPGDLLFKVTAPNPQSGAGFGEVLAAADGNILVGEPGRIDLSTGAVGLVYVFDGRSGVLKTVLANPEHVHLDTFGQALTGGDGRVFISARGLEERVYAFDADTGEYVLRIDDPEGNGNNFGGALAYGNGRLVASSSAYNNKVGTLSIGRAYLFDPIDGSRTVTFSNPEPKAFDTFGTALATFENKVVVGAILDDLPDDAHPDGDNPGRVWVLDTASGEQDFVIENPNLSAPPPHEFGDWFGAPLAANDALIVVGAQEDGTNGVDGSGTVYAFSTDTGVLIHTLYSPRPEINGEFGRSVALTPRGDILVGAFGTSAGGIEDAGYAYLFDGETGKLLLEFPNPEPEQFASFGWTVGAFGDYIAIGTPQNTAEGVIAGGAVFIFDCSLVPEPTSIALAVLSFLGLFLAGTSVPRHREGK